MFKLSMILLFPKHLTLITQLSSSTNQYSFVLSHPSLEHRLFTTKLRKSCNLPISMPSILNMMSVDDFHDLSATLFSSRLSWYSPILTRNTLSSAPYLRRSLNTSTWPASHAAMSGFIPLLSGLLTSTPCFIKPKIMLMRHLFTCVIMKLQSSFVCSSQSTSSPMRCLAMLA